MRIFSLLPLFAVAACGGNSPTSSVEPGNAAAPAGVSSEAAAEKIACALGGAETYLPVCTIDRERDGDATILTLRQPDGGFHRVRQQGTTITAADGAEAAQVTRLEDGSVVVAMSDARYRLAVPLR